MKHRVPFHPLAGVLAGISLLTSALRAAEPDIVFADFEGRDYGGWVKTGESFGDGPARGAINGQMHVEGFQGGGLVNSFFRGDDSKSSASPKFKIERRSILFLIGGGGFESETCLNLIVDGKTVRTATGPNTEPGGSERLETGGWDVRDLAGKEAVLQVVDQRSGSWGHINIDQIVFADRDAPVVAKKLKNQVRTLTLDQQYLLFPVKTGAKKHRVALVVGGKVVRDFEIELSGEPEWWAHLDVSAWKGQEAGVRVDWIDENSRALADVKTSGDIWAPDKIYTEERRSQFHFSPKRGWNNDPNGMVFSGRLVSPFLPAHNPYGWAWGNMHWGHAVSPDMVHWKELPIALYPPVYDDMAFSGSAIVDKDNTSGWKSGTNALLVAAFTSTGRGECIVYSNDRGRTWTEYEGNPVVKHKGRDPKLVWYEPGHHWVMAVYSEDNGARDIAFYTSPDLKKWTWQSKVGGFFECPEFYQLPLDGDSTKMKWILSAADSQYMVGSFDGKVFTPETPKLPGHRGKGYYAAQNFSSEPKGRTVQIGWLQTETKGMPFNQSMSLPIDLSLRSTPEGPRLAWQPVAELQGLRTKTDEIPAFEVDGTQFPVGGELKLITKAYAFLKNTDVELLEVHGSVKPDASSEAGFQIWGVNIVVSAVKKQLRVGNDVTVPVPFKDGQVDLVIYSDRNSVEVFAAGGLVFVPVNIPRSEGAYAVGAISRGGKAAFRNVTVHLLRSIWTK